MILVELFALEKHLGFPVVLELLSVVHQSSPSSSSFAWVRLFCVWLRGGFYSWRRACGGHVFIHSSVAARKPHPLHHHRSIRCLPGLHRRVLSIFRTSSPTLPSHWSLLYAVVVAGVAHSPPPATTPPSPLPQLPSPILLPTIIAPSARNPANPLRSSQPACLSLNFLTRFKV